MIRGSLRSVLALLAVIGALAAAGLFHTWQRVEAIRLGYALSEVTAEHRERMRENERLRVEVATLKAPERIRRVAREELGMVPPRPQQVVVLPAPAVPASATAVRDVDEESGPRG